MSLEGQNEDSGVAVTLFGGNGPFTTTSAADGSFELRVPLATYESVVARARNFDDAVFSGILAVNENGITNIPTLVLRANANDVSGVATLFEGGETSTIAIDLVSLPGEPHAGEHLSPTSRTPDGAYQFLGVPLGTWRASFSVPSEPDRETATRDVEVVAGAPLVVRAVTLRHQFVTINNDDVFTTSPAVRLTLGSSDCVQMRVRNDENFTDNDFVPCANHIDNFVLSGGDGVRTVFAQFKDTLGNVSASASDSILLDTQATISSVTEDSFGAPLDRNDPLHLTLTTGEVGTATVDIVGHDDGIQLYDDGTHGDAVADDGTFERDYVIALNADVTGATVVGHFTDAHGNHAQDVSAVTTVTILVPPRIFAVETISDTQANTETIRWETDEPTTGELRFGTDNTYGASFTTALGTQHSHVITGLSSGIEYHFRILVTDSAAPTGNVTQTADRVFSLRPDAPSGVVALPGDGRFDVRWEAPPQNNVVGYRVYRALTSGGPYGQLTGATPYQSDGLIFSDETNAGTSNVANGTTYFYVVTAIDPFGNESERSAEVTGTPTPNHGPTLLSGVLLGDQVWTSAGSPYRLTGLVLVQSGHRLVIGPGTTVDAPAAIDQAGHAIQLFVEGELVVVGTESAPVVVGSPANASFPSVGLLGVPSEPADVNLPYRRGSLVHGANVGGMFTLADLRVQHSRLRSGLSILNPATAVGVSQCVIDEAIQLNTAAALVVVDSQLGTGSGNSAMFTMNADAQITVEHSNITTQGTLLSLGSCSATNSVVFDGCSIASTRLIDGSGCFPSFDDESPNVTFYGSSITETGPVSDTAPPKVLGRKINLDFVGVDYEMVEACPASISIPPQSGFFQDEPFGCLIHNDVGQTRIVGSRVNASTAGAPWFQGVINIQSSWLESRAGGRGPFNQVQRVSADSMSLLSFPPDATLVGFEDGGGRVDETATYWGIEATAEMEAEGPDSNIGVIYDFFDFPPYPRIRYADFVAHPHPLPRIDAPGFRKSFAVGSPITLSGHAIDAVPQTDGSFLEQPHDPATLTWTSDLDGSLGAGGTLTTSTLRPGPHTITLTATDPDGVTGSVFTELTVTAE